MERRSLAVLAVSVLLAVVATGGARAEEPKKGLEFAKRAFAADVSKQKKSYACFVANTTRRISPSIRCRRSAP